jgi:hypothetical protein
VNFIAYSYGEILFSTKKAGTTDIGHMQETKNYPRRVAYTCNPSYLRS